MADVRAEKEAYAIALTRVLPLRIAESDIVQIEYPVVSLDCFHERFLYTITKECIQLIILQIIFLYNIKVAVCFLEEFCVNGSRYLVTLMCLDHFESCINTAEISSVASLDQQVSQKVKHEHKATVAIFKYVTQPA